MKIRYYLNDLDSRESAYIPKKRGRKAGSTLKKTPGLKRNPKTGKLEAKFNKAYMTQSLQTWLDKKKTDLRRIGRRLPRADARRKMAD